MKFYDIAVIGGGPAGSSFLIHLKKENKVINAVMIDNKGKNKVCGGLLNEISQKFLAELNICIPKDVLVSPQIFSVDIFDLNYPKTKKLNKTYTNMDRDKFDKFLQEKVEYPIIDGKVIKIEKKDKYYLLTYKSGSKKTKLACRYIVGADGGASFTRKQAGIELETREYTSIQKWYNEKENGIKPFLSAIFDSESSDCCSWTISKDGMIIFGGAFPKKDASKIFEIQRKKLENFGIVLKNEVKTEACTVLRPYCMKSFSTGRKNIFLIGEASGLISPSSLEGISFALKSGKALAISFSAKNKRKSYLKKVRPLFLLALSKNIKGIGMYDEKLRQGFISF